MTARIPLFDFMPYGAPELIATQRSNQSRALALASGGAMVAFAAALAIGLRLADPMPVEVSLRDPVCILDVPSPSFVPAPPATPHAAVPRSQDLAFPVPVPDPSAPPPPAPVSIGPVDGVEGANTGLLDVPQSGGVGRGGDGDVIPERGLPAMVDEMPVLVTVVKPTYPDLARDAMIEGRVYVHMLVGKDGKVMRAEIDPKFSVPVLDASALAAARQWVFTPAKRNGNPVMVWVGEMFVYRIE